MGVLIEKERIKGGEHNNRDSNKEADVDPSPHFCDVFFQRVAVLGFEKFFLIGYAGTDLFNGLFLHLRFGSEARNRLGITALELQEARIDAPSRKTRSKTERLK